MNFKLYHIYPAFPTWYNHRNSIGYALYSDVGLSPQSCPSGCFICSAFCPIEKVLCSLDFGAKPRKEHPEDFLCALSFFQPEFSLGPEGWGVSQLQKLPLGADLIKYLRPLLPLELTQVPWM